MYTRPSWPNLPRSPPGSERSLTGVDLGKFGHEGVVDIDGRRQVADEVLEELLAGAAGRSFDNGAEGGNVAAGHQLWRTAPRSACLPRGGCCVRDRLRRMQHDGHLP